MSSIFMKVWAAVDDAAGWHAPLSIAPSHFWTGLLTHGSQIYTMQESTPSGHLWMTSGGIYTQKGTLSGFRVAHGTAIEYPR